MNPSVLGGLVVDFGDKTIDLSVSSRVNKLNTILQRQSFPLEPCLLLMWWFSQREYNNRRIDVNTKRITMLIRTGDLRCYFVVHYHDSHLVF